jgi:hypothetical protein
MPEPPKSRTYIRVAKLLFCHDEDCVYGPDLHLRVEFEDTELEKSSAIAISYTWGEFDREDEFIGHDTESNPLWMNLGKEWDVPETIARLVLLCIENGEAHGSRHAGCWIDQLCILQTDEGIRAALASIPSIYRTLEVVALMPQAICSCVRRRVLEMSKPEQDERLESISSLTCANSLGVGSYLSRVWTRQELLYSRRIRLVRTSDEEIPCAKSVADIGNLSKYESLLFLQKAKEHEWERAAFSAVRNSAIASRAGLAELFNGSEQDMLDFLLGKQVTPPVDLSHEIRAFLTQLAMLGCTSRRKATRARDYVMSVWVDCPGYVIPKDFKRMCLPSLLDDAVRQLEQNHGISVLVSSIPRLFAVSSNGPVLWRPRELMGRRPITDGMGDVYGTVISAAPVPVTRGGAIPLRILTPVPLSLSELSKDYLELFQNCDARTVFQTLKPVLGSMSGFTRMKFGFRDHSHSLQRYFEKGPSTARYLLELKKMCASFRSEHDLEQALSEPIPDSISPDVDHHDVFYEMVATILGLDERQCKASGLRLMVSLTEFPCIGLTKLDLRDRKIFAQGASGSVITVNASRDNEGFLLETIRESGNSPPKYHVAGIWVPRKPNPDTWFIPGGFVDFSGPDGLIV